MKSTKILLELINNNKWEDIIQFALDEKTKSLFSSWLSSKENDSNISKLIQNIPNDFISVLIINFPATIVPYLIKNYKQSYSDIAKNLINNEMKGNLILLPLLDIKYLKIILENLVPEKAMEEFNLYLYIKFVENNPYHYKSIPLKNLRSKQNILAVKNIIEEICSAYNKREDILKLIKETVEEMCEYMSTLDSASVLPILSRVSLITNCFKEKDKHLITKEALKFNYPKTFPNSMFSIFIGGKISQNSFIEGIDKQLVYEEYFVPTVIDEINNKENCQKTLKMAAENMLILKDSYTQINILTLKSFSKIKEHPLNKAWDFMVKSLKGSIINELISSGKSENFSKICMNMNFNNAITINEVSLNYDDSMDIIISSIMSIHDKKEEIVANEVEKYTSIMLYIMNMLVSTYNNENKGESLFRSVFTFLDDKMKDLLIKECIFDPIDEKNYAQWTNNFLSIEKLKIIIRANNIRNIPQYLPKYKCDKNGFVENSEVYILNNKSLKGRISAFELELFESKFWESQSSQIYLDGFSNYKKFVTLLQRNVIEGDKELLDDAYNTNERYNYLLMIKGNEINEKIRLNLISQSFSSPLAFVVGQEKNKKYFEEICEKINQISQIIQSDSINVPYQVAISLIENCYCEELKSLDVVEMDNFINKVLEICYENGLNELNYNFDENYLTPIRELCTNDYKIIVKQYKNTIDEISFKYNSQMIPSNDFPKEIAIPPEAFENSEKIMKTPEMTFGRTLPIAIDFFMKKIKKFKKINSKSKFFSFLQNLHQYLVDKIQEARKYIKIYIELNPGDITMLSQQFTKYYDIYASPSISKIIEKFDKRVQYLCDTQEKIENINQILNMEDENTLNVLEKEFSHEKEVKFKMEIKSIETNKIKSINKFAQIKTKSFEKDKIITSYKSNIRSLNQAIEQINKIKGLNIKKVELPDIDYIYQNEKNFFDFEGEFNNKFFDILFSAEYDPNILKTNINSLCSLVDIIADCKNNMKYCDKITAVISAILMTTDEINLMCQNLNKLIKNKFIQKINIIQIIPQIEEICSWTKEIIERKDKSGILLKTMENFIEILLNSVDYTSKEQTDILIKVLSSYAFSNETGDLKILKDNEKLINFLKDKILNVKNINDNIIASFGKIILSNVPISKEDSSFILSLSQKKLSPFVARQIIAMIAYQMKCQQLYHIKPQNADILYLSLKNIYNQNEDILVPFVSQLIDFQTAKKAIDGSTLFFNTNQLINGIIRMPFGQLQFPRNEEWEKIFDNIIIDIICPALNSNKAHISELAVNILSSVSLSNLNITEKIVPFISNLIDNYNNRTTHHILIKFTTNFVLESANSKYTDIIKSFIKLFQKIGDNLNKMVQNRFNEFTIGEEGFEWTNYETKLYSIVAEQISEKICIIFEDPNESINFENSKELLHLNSICKEIKKLFEKMEFVVITENLNIFNKYVNICSDENFADIAKNYKDKMLATSSFIKLLASSAQFIQGENITFIDLIFNYYIDNFNEDHLKLVAHLTPDFIKYKDIVLMIRESVIMSISSLKIEHMSLLPNLSQIIATKPKVISDNKKQKEDIEDFNKDNKKKLKDGNTPLFVKTLTGKTIQIYACLSDKIEDV